MQLICNKETNVVKYIFEINPTFKHGYLWLPIRALDIKENDYTIIETDDIPEYFTGGGYTYTNEVWVVHNEDLVVNRMKQVMIDNLKTKFNTITRPRVALTLDSGEDIFIDGGRTDKDNFLEEYKRMVRVGEIVGAIRDADNQTHVCTADDVNRGYEAIVDNYSPLMKHKWQTEEAINASTTIAELEAIQL